MAGRKSKSRLRPFYWTLVLSVWTGVGLLGVIAFYAIQLPHMSSLRIPDRPPNVRILSSSGELIANRGITGGEAVSLHEMSPYLPMAAIAIEDRRFETHFGLDAIGFSRAMLANLRAGRFVQGGSTITQQLAKNLFLTPKRTIGRKIQEAILALWLEARFAKSEILELYLNRVYFGSGAYGVEAASRRFFGKSSSDLTLAEAARLAGALKAPSRNEGEAASRRAELVLKAMRREGYISDLELERSSAMNAFRARRKAPDSRHYAADMALRRAKALLGEIDADLIVETSLDLSLQRAASDSLASIFSSRGEGVSASQAAFVALDGSGAIRALSGGRDYARSQFNRAVDALRQPGSAFKPFVYLAGFESGLSPDALRRDAPLRIGDWSPGNHDGEYRGLVPLRSALADSLNTVAVRLILETGPQKAVEAARRLGIRSPIEANASIALGTSSVSLLELTSAYAPFANGGYAAPPYLIERIRAPGGRVLYERDSPERVRVIGERELPMMDSLLHEAVASGTGQAARAPMWRVAGKTGTTQHFRDALFVGYSGNLIAGVWFGNDDGAPMRDVTGATLPAYAFSRFMERANLGLAPDFLPDSALPVPSPSGEEPREPVGILQALFGFGGDSG